MLGEIRGERCAAPAIRQPANGLVADGAVAFVNVRRRLVLIDIHLRMDRRRSKDRKQSQKRRTTPQRPNPRKSCLLVAHSYPKSTEYEQGRDIPVGSIAHCWSRRILF
jgi:hypothetical protein